MPTRRKSSRKSAKPRGKPFPKGKSGNPKGRTPLTPEERQDREVFTMRAREMSPERLEHLEELAKGRGMVAIRATEIIIDRAWGRPKQDVEMDVKGGAGVVIMLPPSDPEPT